MKTNIVKFYLFVIGCMTLNPKNIEQLICYKKAYVYLPCWIDDTYLFISKDDSNIASVLQI